MTQLSYFPIELKICTYSTNLKLPSSSFSHEVTAAGQRVSKRFITLTTTLSLPLGKTGLRCLLLSVTCVFQGEEPLMIISCRPTDL